MFNGANDVQDEGLQALLEAFAKKFDDWIDLVTPNA